jgi:uncharacterized protein (TIGR02391 family)
MPTVAKLSAAVLGRTCEILGHTSAGFTGSELGRLLAQQGILDPYPGITKRDRLHRALADQQSRDGHANSVLAFVQSAMDPVRYTNRRREFDDRRTELNEVLSFVGISIGEDGKLRKAQVATTIAEAVQRANRLRSTLRERDIHADVLKYCRPELLEKDYFHAVFEASKGLADRLRSMTSLQDDGAALVDQALGYARPSSPRIAFNRLQTASEESEHRGLAMLMKGVFGAYRNPTAHEPRVVWPVSEQDAFDVLSILSLLHRRLDVAVVLKSR